MAVDALTHVNAPAGDMVGAEAKMANRSKYVAAELESSSTLKLISPISVKPFCRVVDVIPPLLFFDALTAMATCDASAEKKTYI